MLQGHLPGKTGVLPTYTLTGTRADGMISPCVGKMAVPNYESLRQCTDTYPGLKPPPPARQRLSSIAKSLPLSRTGDYLATVDATLSPTPQLHPFVPEALFLSRRLVPMFLQVLVPDIPPQRSHSS